MAIIPYRPVRGYGATLNGDAQLEDVELQDADLTQPGVVLRGPGARELAARVHEGGGTESALDPEGGQALFWRPDGAGDELCMVHDDTLYTSKPTEVTVNGTQAWRRVGTWAPWRLRHTALVQPETPVRDWDVAVIAEPMSGRRYYVAVWEQPNLAGDYGQTAAPGVYAMAVDESGGLVAPATLLASGARYVNPRACACDTGVVIVWADNTNGSYESSAWLLSNPIEFSATVVVVTVAPGNSNLHDMRKDGANDRVIFAFADSVGAFQIGLRRIAPSLASSFLSATAVVQAPSVGISVDVDPLGGYLLTWANATTANAVHVDSSGAVDTVIATLATANPIVRITGCHVDGIASQGTIAVEQRVGASPSYDSHVQVFDYDGAALANVRTQRGAVLSGHAMVAEGRPLAMTTHYYPGIALLLDSLPATVFISDLRTGEVFGRAFPLSASNFSAADAQLFTQPASPVQIGGSLVWGFKRTATYRTAPSALATAGIFTVELQPQAGPRQPATVPGYVMDALGGFPGVFDGDSAGEADWHTQPTFDTATAGVGGSLISSSTYVVAVTYRWVDRRGNMWRSAPTAIAVPLGVGQDLITVDVLTARWASRSNVAIEIWRSLSNSGFPLYLERVAAGPPPRGLTPNDKTVDLITMEIRESDAAAVESPQLDQFATDNVLGHESVPVTDFMAYALGRFWSPDPERPDIIRHTIAHEIDRDGFGWGWEDTQLVQLDTSVRPQAMGPLDGPSLAVLAGDVCHLVHGLGPDKQGSGLFGQVDKFGVVDLETSQPLTARVPDSAIPGGLAYATPRGLFILRRDRVSQMLSVQVDRLFRVDGLVPQALAYLPTHGELMLVTLASGQRSLRFSLTTGRWCADSARQAQDVAASPRGEVAWLLSDVRVRILDASRIADGDDALHFRGTTPTIRLDPSNVGQSGTVQAILLHTYLVTGPALLDVEIHDTRTGQVITLLQQTYSAVGPESRSLPLVNLATNGHRVAYSQPPGDTGKIVITEIDSQVQPADVVICRTVTQL